MAEEARLESVYTPKGYPGFESRSLRALVFIPCSRIEEMHVETPIVYEEESSV